MVSSKQTYEGRGFVVQDLLDLLEDLRGELRDNLQRLEVVNDLLGLRRAEDDGARVRFNCQPGQREMVNLASEF